VNPGPVVPGRVEITARALTTLARAVAAERLGVPAKRLRVGLDDAQGSLAVEVTGPIREQSDIVAAARPRARASSSVSASCPAGGWVGPTSN